LRTAGSGGVAEVDDPEADTWTTRADMPTGVTLAVPGLDDLILTKRFGGRPKDLEDIRLLEALRKEEA
jgi:hypothetical protein